MPALQACCRKWEFASDDLVFPFFAAVIFRVLCLLGTLVAVGYFRESYGCPESRLLIGFTFSVVAIIIVAIVVDFFIMIFSARGTMVRPHPRWPVKHLLHIRVLAFLVEILLLVVGTVIAFKPDIGGSAAGSPKNATDSDCLKTGQAITLIRIISGVDWCVLLVLVVVGLVYLDPLHCYSTRPYHKVWLAHTARGEGSEEPEQHWIREQNTWEKRFKVACCITGRDDEHQVAFKEVAQLFANFFGDLNAVPSDVAAGLALLQKKHLIESRKERTNHPLSVPLDLHGGEDRETFKRSLHYLKHALAIYTWSLHIYMNLKCGLCSLCQYLSIGACSTPNEYVVGDNCCGCNMAGVRRVAEVDEDDIVYASFMNGIYRSPFLVILDHEYRSVVVSIRGTLSMGDIITDLVANPEPIELPPPHSQYSVHKGMLRTAERIRDQLLEENILARAFSRAEGYDLVIVGHSLGAGCAAILGLLLRPTYPDLHCYCYSPPGTIIDDQGAAYTETFVTSITLGHDLVSHSSIHTFNTLKEDLVKAIEQSRKPKYRIFLEGGLETSCWCIGKQVVFEDKTDEGETQRILQEDEDNAGGTGFVSIVSKSLSNGKEDADEVLFVPGKIIHLTDTGASRGCCSSVRTLEPQWAHRSRFKKIEVTPGMIRDHFPDVISAAMKTVWTDNVDVGNEANGYELGSAPAVATLLP